MALSFTNTLGSARPNTGASVTIVPEGTQNVAVTGPAEAVSVGTLVIEGSGSDTASLALTSSGSLTATSVSVPTGGSLTDNAGTGGGR